MAMLNNQMVSQTTCVLTTKKMDLSYYLYTHDGIWLNINRYLSGNKQKKNMGFEYQNEGSKP